MALRNNFGPLCHRIRNDDQWLRFLEFKKTETPKKFCETNDCEFLIEALEECYSLRYDQEPNYAKLKFILQKALLEENLLPGGKYLHERP